MLSEPTVEIKGLDRLTIRSSEIPELQLELIRIYRYHLREERDGAWKSSVERRDDQS